MRMKTVSTSGWEKVLLAFLIVASAIEFVESGYEGIKQILAILFGVSLPGTTFLDPIIAIVAVAASALVVVGAVLRWRGRDYHVSPLLLGFGLFIFRGVFEILAEILAMKSAYATITERHIEQLASGIGDDLLEIAIWILLLLYFSRKRIAKSE